MSFRGVSGRQEGGQASGAGWAGLGEGRVAGTRQVVTSSSLKDCGRCPRPAALRPDPWSRWGAPWSRWRCRSASPSPGRLGCVRGESGPVCPGCRSVVSVRRLAASFLVLKFGALADAAVAPGGHSRAGVPRWDSCSLVCFSDRSFLISDSPAGRGEFGARHWGPLSEEESPEPRCSGGVPVQKDQGSAWRLRSWGLDFLCQR